MRSVIALFLFLLLIVAPAPTRADVIKVDPNTPQTATAAEPVQQVDKRLAQKVTYEARKKTVSSILTDLSDMTGVELHAGYNSQDWQVRDRKMNIFAKDVPLASLMNSVARVMKFKWSRSDDPKAPSYRLYMDRQTLLNAESQKAREEERYAKQQAEKRMETFEQFANLGNLSPQELAKLKEENPFLYLAKTSGVVDSLSSFFREVPMAVDALASGQEMMMSASKMTPTAQQGLLKTIQSMSKIEGMVTKHENPLPDDLAQNIGQVTVSMNQSLAMMEGLGNSSLLGDISIQYHGRQFDVPMFDPNSKMAKLMGKVLVQSIDENRPIEEVGRNMEGEFFAAMITERKQSSLGEPLIEHPEDPALDAKVKLDIQGMTSNLLDIEAELAKATGMTVVADSFGITHGFSRFDNQETEIKRILESISDGYNYNWDKQGDVIELRDREWFKKRAAQIPEEWLENWRESLKKTGTLTLDEMAQIAVLTLEQINTNIMADDVLGRANMAGVVYMGRDMLRFYSSLDQQQKQIFLSESGLNLKSLSPTQWPQAEKLAMQRNGAFFEDPDADVIATGMKSDDTYDFTFRTTAPDTKPISWSFPAPRYVEPKQESAKEVPAEKIEAK